MLSSIAIKRLNLTHVVRQQNILVKKNRNVINRSFSNTLQKQKNNDSVDTLIIGGGPIGLSTAYHLAKMRNDDGRGITVLERDPKYTRASATLSAGGIRQQFSLKENVQMTLYGVDFLTKNHDLFQEDELQFQQNGYLFLATSAQGMERMKQNHDIQVAAGCDHIHLLSPDQLRDKFPWLNVSDVYLGSYGTKGEGWFDPWAYINRLREKCSQMGVEYVHGQPVSASRDGATGNIKSVKVNLFSPKDSGTQVKDIHSKYIVNAAGAHCSTLMEMLAGEEELHYPIPVKPRKRCLFFFNCSTKQQEVVPDVAPLTVDSSMVYFRSDGGLGQGNFICGVSPPTDRDPDYDDNQKEDGGLSVDHDLFEEIIWPALYHRVPAFGDIKVKSSWAGFYEYNTVDQNAIIDFHPEIPNALMINGFSGHGLQQSPAAGRAGAELISHDNKFQSLDLNRFRFDRMMENGQPVYELGII